MSVRSLNGRRLFSFFKRCNSTQSATKVKDHDASQAGSPVVNSLSNGIVSVSSEPDAPVARVAVLVAAGSRYERNEQKGINHYIRLMTSQATNRTSNLGLIRHTQQMGANISCTSHREYMMYTVECLKEFLPECVNYLREVATTPAFKPWEITDMAPYAKYDLALFKLRPNIQCTELLNEVAFHDTLGRSLFMPECHINKFSSEDLMEYVSNNYTQGSVAVMSSGVDHAQMKELAETFEVHRNPGKTKTPAKYHGGELRLHTRHPIVYASLCTEGVGYGNTDAYPAWVLQGVLGTGPHMKWNLGHHCSRLGTALGGLNLDPVNAITCLDACYSDCGLFGFMVAAEHDKVGQVIEAGCKEFASLRSKPITEEEVNRGKNMAKSALYTCLEVGEYKLLDMGDQVLWNGQFQPPQEVAKKIDSVTVEDVNRFAKKTLKGRWSMSAVGDLTHTPYLSSFADTQMNSDKPTDIH